MNFVKAFLCSAILASAVDAYAVTYKVPTDGSRLVGEVLVTTVPGGNASLESIAAEYQQGLSNIMEANPKVDPYSPKEGTTIIIPQQLILPDTVHEGIVVNSAEMRLYYYHNGLVDVLPVGIGQLGKDTPVDWVTKVERKKAGPTWTPTAQTRAEYAAKGEPLPPVVPAGKDNPMGLYALYVGRLFAIHGTNANFGIGLRVFNNVPVNTRVQFINEPVKVTKEPDGGIYVEVHQPLSTNMNDLNSTGYSPITLKPAIRNFFIENDVDKSLLDEIFNNRSGIPELVNTIDF